MQSYSATCPELNFVLSYGDTRKDAIASFKDVLARKEELIS